MVMERPGLTLFVVFVFIAMLVSPPRPVQSFGAVLELGPDFLQKKNNGMWFVKFYAPWCGHCRRLEPVWIELEKRVRPLGVNVARLDATLHDSVAAQFNVRGYPTLIFFKGDKTFTYSGSRNLENLEQFVKRVSGPAVEVIDNIARFIQLRASSDPFFLYYGDESPTSTLYKAYSKVSDDMQSRTFFKKIDKTEFLPKDMTTDEKFVKDSVAVVKGTSFYKFEPEGLVCTSPHKQEECESLLKQWALGERLPNYQVVTFDNFHDVQNNGGKLLALAVIPEDDARGKSMADKIKNIANNYRSRYASQFTFGHIRDVALFTDLTLDSMTEYPGFVVLNLTSEEYYFPEQQGTELTQGTLMHFLDNIKSGGMDPLGGYSIGRRFKRVYHELSKAISDLFSAGFIIVLLVMAVPVIVISCLCYMLCTMDASEETLSDEEGEGEHEGALADPQDSAYYERQRRDEDDLEGLRHRQVTADDASS